MPAKMGGSGNYDVGHTCNSILAGLVGITAGCASVSAPGSLVIGFLSAFVYHGASCLMRKLKIDDPLDAFAVHGACGFWGCIAVGLFAVQSYSYVPNSGNPMYASIGGYDGGAFTGESKGAVLGAELVALIIEIIWVGGTSSILFGTLKMAGMLRVSTEVEVAGLDSSKHGGTAYSGNAILGDLDGSKHGGNAFKPPSRRGPSDVAMPSHSCRGPSADHNNFPSTAANTAIEQSDVVIMHKP